VELSGLRTLYVLTNRFRRPEPETAAVASLIIGVKALLAIKHRAEREWLQKQHRRGRSGDWRLVSVRKWDDPGGVQF